jgi:protein-tyrosine phosphatase
MGNICRSPAAEAVTRRVLAERGLDGEVEVDSAGTIGYHAGQPPDARMSRAGRARGLELEGAARRVTAADFDRFDLIVALDRENLGDLGEIAREAAGGAELRLLSEFLPGGEPADVPDPYYGGERGFDTVLDLLDTACPAVVDHLLGTPAGAGDRGPNPGSAPGPAAG